MKRAKLKKISGYWYLGSKHSFETIEALFNSKRYSDALFFGHIVLEKILKALVVEKTAAHASMIHDLVKLADFSGVVFTKEDLTLLHIVNEFNIKARYPDIKLAFYKKCDFAYTEGMLNRIKILYGNLCLKMKLRE